MRDNTKLWAMLAGQLVSFDIFLYVSISVQHMLLIAFEKALKLSDGYLPATLLDFPATIWRPAHSQTDAKSACACFSASRGQVSALRVECWFGKIRRTPQRAVASFISPTAMRCFPSRVLGIASTTAKLRANSVVVRRAVATLYAD